MKTEKSKNKNVYKIVLAIQFSLLIASKLLGSKWGGKSTGGGRRKGWKVEFPRWQEPGDF